MNNESLEYNNLIIFPGTCKDSVDPKGLGRIRAIDKTRNEGAQISSINDNNALQDVSEAKKWTDEDSFVYRPLLPWFINQVPKENEMVHLFYSNLGEKGSKNKFYVAGIFSSPTKAEHEPYDSAKEDSDLGSQIKKSIELYNKKTGEIIDPKSRGVYGLQSDIVFNGRGTADIIIKDNSVELRAGKTRKIEPNQFPVANGQRAFLQLSQYDTQTTFNVGQRFYRLRSEHKPIKILVEYNITNPDGGLNQLYNGYVRFYNLNPNNPYANTEKMDLNSDIKTSEITPVFSVDFGPYPEQRAFDLINEVLKRFAYDDPSNTVSDLLGNDEFPNLSFSNNDINSVIPRNDAFPFYYRPQLSLYKSVRPDSTATIAQRLFVTRLMSNIKLVDDDLTGGYGLAYGLDKNDKVQQFVPEKVEKENVIDTNIQNVQNTASLLGGDVLYLLSHKSQKKDLGKINLSNTLTGITESFLRNEIEPKTSSTVRGEELIELLNLIVRFLLNHVHPYHGMAPDSQTLDGVRADELYEELRNAQEKILNKYIRIN